MEVVSMLAMSDRYYYVPRRYDTETDTVWIINRIGSSEENPDYTVASNFNYTALVYIDGKLERLTFEYHGRSVRPSIRTLRKFGSEFINPLISKLSQNKIYGLFINNNTPNDFNL
jgi:hypothetical protein